MSFNSHPARRVFEQSNANVQTVSGLSLIQFGMVFGMFVLVSPFLLLMASGMEMALSSALALALAGGVIFTAGSFFLARSRYYAVKNSASGDESSERSQGESDASFTPDASGGHDPHEQEEREQEELRHSFRMQMRKRKAEKKHDVMLRHGAILSVLTLGYWFAMNKAFGLSPTELFGMPWWAVGAVWFLMLAWMPQWFAYPSFFMVAGFRYSVEVFGAMLIMYLPNFLMLPFFYAFMMVFMYGSILWPTLKQFKVNRPGDATWGVREGTMRGQPEALITVLTEIRKFYAYARGESDRRPTRGMILEGPPGTGKTLLVKEIASNPKYPLPFVIADGGSLSPPWMGFGNIVTDLYHRPLVEGAAKEYGGCIFAIDEAEVAFAMRGGMQNPGSSYGGFEIRDIWDLFPTDHRGCVSACGMTFDVPSVRERFWNRDHQLATPKNNDGRPYTHPMMFFGGGGGGGNSIIFSYLTWMDGAATPPFFERLGRGKWNDLMDACFVPYQILRFGPGKAPTPNIMFMLLTNRAWMLDLAIRRPGRCGVTARFVNPKIEGRKDVADLYMYQGVKKKWIHPDLYTPEKLEEIARSTQGMSPAEIEQMIAQGADVRIHHVETLKRIKESLVAGLPEHDLFEQDRKYWLRYKHELETPGWDDPRADWRSLMEARNQVLWGRADPTLTSETHKHMTRIHEFYGHFIELFAWLRKHMRPTVLSVMPRGSALGMVAHVPVEERDPMPQSFYSGMMQVSIGSTIAERFFFNENQPGVSADLANATGIACFMVGKCAMPPYKCSPEDWKRYYEMGKTLISVSESSPLTENGRTFVEKVLSNPDMHERVAVMLGQAAVNCYRLIRTNMHVGDAMMPEFAEIDEFSGKKLEDLWNSLEEALITFTDPRMPADVCIAWPDRHFAPESPFYKDHIVTEAEELAQS